jgi:NAD(P)-dependent dehydrogenase (short-subunit alcohol dehydrogenase family)
MMKRSGHDRQARWTAAAIPDLSGRTAVVTGANTGIGYETARVLCAKGAGVVLACRDIERGEAAAARIRAETGRHGPTMVRCVLLDLASMASVRAAAAVLTESLDRLDVLVNNAGIMEPPYQVTSDGFESTVATNHLGPFAFTGLLMDCLIATPGSRVVTVSSEGHRRGVMDVDDLQSEGGYSPDDAYCRSKLANLLFTYELDRRLRAAGLDVAAVAAHPGIVSTELFKTRSRLGRLILSPWLKPINFWLAQSVQMGALPTLRAATDPAVRGGEFFGPAGLGYTGYPARVEPGPRAHAVEDQTRLWEVSERLTGVAYRLEVPPRVA